ncbi:MAG: hypothetical protein IJD85_08760 [Oscillospiraceae bacterium]|nr:hypothetical protein [Oscillospiraceae bacterium]
MTKRQLLIAISIALLAMALILVYLFTIPKQTISYEKSMLIDNIGSFETAAETCMELYKNNKDDSDVWLFNVDVNMDSLVCYNSNGQLRYPLTQEQKQAFTTVKAVFRLDHLGFANLFVNEDFASFGIENGRASFIYSPSARKPNFVNLPEHNDNDRIFVEQITDNWFYACK